MQCLDSKASELPLRLKSVVEQLLGRPIDADEEVGIGAVPPEQIAPSKSRASVAEKLDAFLNQRAAKVSDVSDDELDAAIDDAVDHLRHRIVLDTNILVRANAKARGPARDFFSSS